MIHNDTWYEVKTHWGAFRLDAASYQDYLNGNLWISSYPKKKIDCSTKSPKEYIPTNISKQAIQIRDFASKYSFITALERLPPDAEIIVPYKERMSEISIEELNLSIRSSNGLMRAGATTLGKLRILFEKDKGIMSVRNLGAKSAKEIEIAFITTCYQQLSQIEKALFWQEIINQGISLDNSIFNT